MESFVVKYNFDVLKECKDKIFSDPAFSELSDEFKKDFIITLFTQSSKTSSYYKPIKPTKKEEVKKNEPTAF